jgi:hypothetical protein
MGEPANWLGDLTFTKSASSVRIRMPSQWITNWDFAMATLHNGMNRTANEITKPTSFVIYRLHFL